MTRHFNEDAERIAMVKKTRKSVTIILMVTVVLLMYALYQLIK